MGFDVHDSVRGDPEANTSGPCGRRGINVRCLAEDDGDEETVPRAPGIQRSAVNREPVRHLPDGESTKADDPTRIVRVREALEIRASEELVHFVGCNREGFRERGTWHWSTTRELPIDLESQAPLLLSHGRKSRKEIGGEGAYCLLHSRLLVFMPRSTTTCSRLWRRPARP